MGQPMIIRILLPTICFCAFLLPASAGAANYDDSLKQLAEHVTAEVVKAKKRRVALVEFTDSKGESTSIGRFLTDELATQLEVGGEVKVIERSQVQAALHAQHVTAFDPPHAKAVGKVAETIKADAFVTGTYVETPNGVQVTMKLIRPKKADVFAAARGSLPKTGQLADLIKDANKPPVKVDHGPKKPDVPEGLGFHRNDQYELVVHTVSKTGKLAKVDATVENRSSRDLKILCLLQDTTLHDTHGVVWSQRIEDNREGLCTRGVELQPREKERVVLIFSVPSEDETSHVSLHIHETSPRRDAVYTLEHLPVNGTSATAGSTH